MADEQLIDLYDADAARVSVNPNVPYAWQFADEDVFMRRAPGGGLNCLALLKRNNQCLFETTPKSINSEFIFEQFEQLSMKRKKLTVVVLDNALVHTARLIRERRQVRQRRGLFLFYLPRYSPHLNIVEILWRKLKYYWLAPQDYETNEGMFDTVRQALAAVGTSLRINFSKFNLV